MGQKQEKNGKKTGQKREKVETFFQEKCDIVSSCKKRETKTKCLIVFFKTLFFCQRKGEKLFMKQQQQIYMRCEDCLWKTVPQNSKIVCLFPYCIYEKKKTNDKKKQ